MNEHFTGKKSLKDTGVPLIDIGTSSLTGASNVSLPNSFPGKTAHPVFQIEPLEAQDYMALGSDFIRTGLLFSQPEIPGDSFTDVFGVSWVKDRGFFVQNSYPLEDASIAGILQYPKPVWEQELQTVDLRIRDKYLVIADAPCPGLLTQCFMLRGTWQFLEDMADNRQIMATLLEWALETIVQAYTYMLDSLGYKPDIVIYNDDLGYKDSMYFSPGDFRKHIQPFMDQFLSRLRKLTPAPVCFHSCGSIRPILPNLIDLGIRIFNLDTGAKGMSVQEIRYAVPDNTLLHGTTDLCALGRYVETGDKAGIAMQLTELARSMPAIAAPMDSMSSDEEVLAASRGAEFIRNITADGFLQLQKIGPVRSVIENALQKTGGHDQPVRAVRW
jgi:hypothetical protein